MTPTGKPARNAARHRYLCELVGERLSGVVQEHYTTDAMERGTMLEPRARAWYEIQTGADVARPGFVFADESRRWGCSPDGLMADGGLEIKCPLRINFVAMLLDDGPPTEYLMQCQAAMWICQRRRWDLLLYTEDEGIPNRVWTIERDPVLHAAFEEILPAFCADLEAAVATLRALGGGVDKGSEMAAIAEAMMPTWTKGEE
jgi:exodeoxyribonuclease (lambda-induced)